MDQREADEVVNLLRAAVGGKVEEDQLEFFRAALSRLDYDKGMAAAVKGTVIWRYFPSWAQFREMYGGEEQSERVDREAAERRKEEEEEEAAWRSGKREIPQWVKRWVAARYLFKLFDRDQDLRPFPEQRRYVDAFDSQGLEWMPENEWVEEAKAVSNKQVWGALGSAVEATRES